MDQPKRPIRYGCLGQTLERFIPPERTDHRPKRIRGADVWWSHCVEVEERLSQA